MGRLLSQGGFGRTFEAKWKNRTVAVKVCVGDLLEHKSPEIEILTSLPPHPNIITFFGVSLSSDHINTYIVTELAVNGSLHDYLYVKMGKPSPDQSLAWALQVASGMQHLHSNNVVHRDLKSANILLCYGLFAKVTDFDTARTMMKTTMTLSAGTLRWMAPEIMADVEANINKMCDVFSYGMVMYEIFACEIPYANLVGDFRVGMAVLQGERPPVPATLPPFLHPLLQACWNENPNHRPQFEAIVTAIQTGIFE